MKKLLSVFIACMMAITMVACNEESTDNSKSKNSNHDTVSSEQDTTAPLPELESTGLYNGSLVNTTWLVPIKKEFYEFSFTKDSMKIQEYCYSWDKESLKYTLSEIKTETVPCIVTDSEIQFDTELIKSYYDTNEELFLFLLNNLQLSPTPGEKQIILYYRVIDSIAFLTRSKSLLSQETELKKHSKYSILLNPDEFFTMKYKHTEYSNEELLEFLDGAWIGAETEDIDKSQDLEAEYTDAFEINSKEKSIVFSSLGSFWEKEDELPLIDYISGDITGAIGYIDMVYIGTSETLTPWPSRMFVEIIDEQTIQIFHYKDHINMYTFKRTDAMPESIVGTDEYHTEMANRNAKSAYNSISNFSHECSSGKIKISADDNVVSPLITIDTSDRSSPNVYNITSAVAGSNKLADGAEEELAKALSQSFGDESDGASVIIIFNKEGYPEKVYYAEAESEFVGCYPDDVTGKTPGGIKTYLN